MSAGSDAENVAETLTTRQTEILGLIRKNNATPRKLLAKELGVTDQTIYRELETLKSKGIIERIGHDKGGHWKIKR